MLNNSVFTFVSYLFVLFLFSFDFSFITLECSIYKHLITFNEKKNLIIFNKCTMIKFYKLNFERQSTEFLLIFQVSTSSGQELGTIQRFYSGAESWKQLTCLIARWSLKEFHALVSRVSLGISMISTDIEEIKPEVERNKNWLGSFILLFLISLPNIDTITTMWSIQKLICMYKINNFLSV